jgi:glycosyltransferase involved in cell wall biosynthesis
MTHPVQYVAPWFRYIASHRRELDLTVLYGAVPTPQQQGVGFGCSFSWDVPLTEGYTFHVCGAASGSRFESDQFFGIDVPDIAERLVRTRPDVVLVPGWHSVMQVRALRACRRLGIPVLYRGDSTLVSGPRGPLRPLWILKTRLMLGQYDAYLSVGLMANRYLRAFNVPEPLIFHSPHCVDNERFAAQAERLRDEHDRARLRETIGARHGDFVVFFAGKFQPCKRPIDAVRAVARLGPRALLMMAGNGALAGEARAEATRLGVRLCWRGFLNQSQLPAAFVASDCVVVPSARESWGLIINEALASGLPCVTTSGVAAAADLIVEGETGYSVAAGDIDALSARLDQIRRARENGHEFALRCRERVEACSFERATDGLVAASRRALARRRARSADHARSPRVIACCGNMVNVFGVERMTFEVLRVLGEHHAAVHCIVNRWESSQIINLADAVGASWSSAPYHHAFRRRGWTLLYALRLAWDIMCASSALLGQSYRLRATHVLMPDFTALLRNLPAVLVLRLFRIQIVLKLGNAPETAPFYRRLWRWVINPGVDRFVANSYFTANELLGTGVPSRKVQVIYNAAPSRVCTSSSGGVARAYNRVIYVGQMIPTKGVDRLLEAVGLLVARGYDVCLDAVGDIEGWEPPGWTGFRRRLRERADEPDLRGRVRFLGIREDVPALLASAGMHCCPSQPQQREAFGVVNVEAKIAGIPSVVTPTGALRELIDHLHDGFVCTDATAEALAEGLEYFLSSRDRLERASRNAAASQGRFSRDRFVEGWLAAFGAPLAIFPSCQAPVSDAQ